MEVSKAAKIWIDYRRNRGLNYFPDFQNQKSHNARIDGKGQDANR
jgi:hypothetical protein